MIGVAIAGCGVAYAITQSDRRDADVQGMLAAAAALVFAIPFALGYLVPQRRRRRILRDGRAVPASAELTQVN